MNGKDIVAVIMAVNKIEGSGFSQEDEDVSTESTSDYGLGQCFPTLDPIDY